ncbi:methyltransferase domain-containing protein [Verticiella sediminum]|uniref:Methyltransferase domain-containing protein n=1 Tax=Verticiella sediminum TaxID=1247510 RepID=A0A556A6K9_9BURK|nr:class I SAM-dependent methyltransferase [Verticiella sediminum]TSH88526.1 methyltransferase domain-containing protein [Verticiella sediminum]
MNAPDLANQQIAKDYDDRPYTSNAFFYAAPGHIRATAWLYGVDTVPLKQARVLELGCAAGGNLLPFATLHPEATVVGVDLSSVQVEQGRQVIADLGIRNLTLHAMSLTDITPDFGQFDYIIAHGVFSWVPPEVREAMLRICRENLSPQGVAYISYNTYPGWKAGDIVRDAMMLHSHGAQTIEERLERAKTILTLLSDGLAAANPLAPSLRGAVQQLRRHSDYYIAHEYLETFNAPCYFVEFAAAADQAGLAYIGDAEGQTELGATYGNNVQLNHSLIAMGQPKAMRQQYLDFAVGRNFRKSLLTHAERANDIATSPELARLRDLRIAAGFRSVDAPAASPAGMQHYQSNRGRSLATREAPVVAVVEALSSAWPACLSRDELAAATLGKSGAEGDAHDETIGKAVETLYRLGMLYLSRDGGAADAAAAEHPQLVTGLAYLKTRGADPGFGVGPYTYWHDVPDLSLKPAEMFVLEQLDGKRSLTQVRTALRDALSAGQVPGSDGKMLTGQRNLDGTAQQIVQKLVELLRRQGVMLG